MTTTTTTRAGAAGHPVVHVEPVMGTMVTITIDGVGLAAEDVDAAVVEACAELHRADRVFSTWTAWSPMSRLRRGAVRLDQLPDDVAAEISSVLALCWDARRATDGWFDPWAMPGGVDPTGLVKGWAIEQAMGVLDKASMASAVVNGGGDIVVHGDSPEPGGWRIGVQHPWRRGALACVVAVDHAVATSGGYERGTHLVDPRRGVRTAGAVASATVTGPSLAVADALATAVAVGADEALALVGGLPGYEAYLIGHDGREISTPGFPSVPA